jgi:20S proteasome alpha/beta subunit
MEQYFVRITTAAGPMVKDEEPEAHPNLQAAQKEAVKSARDILTEAIEAGQDTDVEAVIVIDEHGQELHRVSLMEVLPASLKQHLRDKA